MSHYEGQNVWALILGGSSGIGLASAKKLADEGMNLFIVHRDRRGAMGRVEPEFEKLRASGVKVETMNTNALSQDGRSGVLNQVADHIGDGKIRLLLHSIALGNLKLLVPENSLLDQSNTGVAKLAAKLGIDNSELQNHIDDLFNSGDSDLVDSATPAVYSQELIAGEEDFSQTIYNMGTSLLFWVQDLHSRGMFAKDARVLGLTSEGNSTAWKSYAAISAAKCALESVARSIAMEFASYGIRCNVLQPGVTDTPALRLIPGSDQMKAHATQRNPFGRLTMPEDVANVVDLMCRRESAWINGTVIRVDGGEHISG